MEKKLFYLLIFSLFAWGGCSTSKKQDPRHVELDEAEKLAAPEWIYAPDQGCDAGFLCATGEGESFQRADARSRKALAAVFSTHIRSQFDIHKTSYSDQEIEELKEHVSSKVAEQVEGLLKGAEIKKRYSANGLSYSLAALDKGKASNSLKREIRRIDDELAHLYSLKRKSVIKKMMGLLDERAKLADKLIVLNGEAKEAPLTFSQIQNIRFSKQGHDKVRLKSVNQVPASFEKYLGSLLSSSGYKVRTDSAVDYFLNLKYDAKEAYLNVEGFKKFVFSLTVDARNNVKEKIGSFTVNQTSSGRNEQDAFLKAKPAIQKQMEKKLSRLNLE